MRTAALSTLLLLAVAACGTTPTANDNFVEPNALMGEEIQDRVAQIPYLHREELFNNLLWLVQSGEQAIPALLSGLENEDPKVRSNCAWVLGQIGDRRVIPHLRPLVRDDADTVRLEAARTLVGLGDVQFAPTLIEGLDSEKVQVRYLCNEALKGATGRDFGFDHLTDDALARNEAVYAWRLWWSEQSGDTDFAESYAAAKGLNAEPAWTEPVEQPATPDR